MRQVRTETQGSAKPGQELLQGTSLAQRRNGASEPQFAYLNNVTCIIPSPHSDAFISVSVPDYVHEEKLENKMFSERA